MYSKDRLLNKLKEDINSDDVDGFESSLDDYFQENCDYNNKIVIDKSFYVTLIVATTFTTLSVCIAQFLTTIYVLDYDNKLLLLDNKLDAIEYSVKRDLGEKIDSIEKRVTIEGNLNCIKIIDQCE